MKECPMCGESMQLSERELQERAPGGTKNVTRRVREWICRECDHFEEAEGGEEERGAS